MNVLVILDQVEPDQVVGYCSHFLDQAVGYYSHFFYQDVGYCSNYFA